MPRVTELNEVAFAADGTIRLQFMKRAVDTDGTVLAAEPHRVSISPEQDLAEALEPEVSAVENLGYPMELDTVRKTYDFLTKVRGLVAEVLNGKAE